MPVDLDAGLNVLHGRELLPGTNQASVFAIGIVFSIIGILVMGLRIHCRLHLINCGLGTDDCEPSRAPPPTSRPCALIQTVTRSYAYRRGMQHRPIRCEYGL